MKRFRVFAAAVLVISIVLSSSAQGAILSGEYPRALVSAIAKAPKPRSIVIVNPIKRLSIDETFALTCIIKPALAAKDVMWYASNTVVSVSDDGLITPNRVGKVKITARAKAKLTVKDFFTLEVYDPNRPTGISIQPEFSVSEPGQTVSLSVITKPAGADKEVDWSSSNPQCATVDENGLVSVLSYGQCVITAIAKNGGAKATSTVVALMPGLAVTTPARSTSKETSAIKDNIKLINDILTCSVGEIAKLASSGKITSGERIRRTRIVNNAFDMYKFAWYTDTRVRYWTSAYAGKKDFYPGKVYYGLPYIQSGASGSRVNRRFNVNKALSGGYFVRRSEGLYRMSSKRNDSSYVGSDCSSFVGMSTFVGNGYSVGNGVCFMLTSSIVSSPMYRPVASFDDLRTGDIIVQGHNHAVMFLYYVDDEKTKMMIIEQGGGTNADMHNTVSCSVVNRSKYEFKYVVRRAKFLAV